jgi:hypothetical protein
VAAGQRALDGSPVEDLDVVASRSSASGTSTCFPGIGDQRAGPARPADGQIARAAGRSPRLFDMDRREGDEAPPGRGEAQRGIARVADRPRGRADAPVPRQAEIGLGDGQRWPARCPAPRPAPRRGRVAHRVPSRAGRAAGGSGDSGRGRSVRPRPPGRSPRPRRLSRPPAHWPRRTARRPSRSPAFRTADRRPARCPDRSARSAPERSRRPACRSAPDCRRWSAG